MHDTKLIGICFAKFYSITTELFKPLVSGFSLPGNEKSMTIHQECWYFNERTYYEEFEHENTLTLASTRDMEF